MNTIALLLLAQAPVPIVVENIAPVARTEWVRVVVPESRVFAPMVARTPSGAVLPAVAGATVGRGRAVHVYTSLAAGERLALSLARPDDADRPPWAFAVQVDDRPPLDLDGWTPALVDRLADGPTLVSHWRGRVANSQLCADLWTTRTDRSPVIRWELLVVSSDPRTTAIYQDVPALRLRARGGLAVVSWWEAWRGVVRESADTLRLLTGETFGDTQGQAWAGVVALETTERAAPWLWGPACAMADPAAWQGSWGPFDAAPAGVPYSPGASRQDLLGWWTRTSQPAGGPWSVPDWGLSANSGDTGSQHDFGASKLGPAFLLPGGSALQAWHGFQAALCEAHRPGNFLEANGVPVWPLAHPDHTTWDGYTHWHPSVSGDRLGKTGQPTPSFTGSWRGPDREHWSNNVLAGAYQLSGSPVLLTILERQARQILSGETIDPRLSTSHAGAARGIGRTLLAASWIDCCLPDGQLRVAMRERVRARIALIEVETRSSTTLAPLWTTEDPRVLGGQHAIVCWQEALGLYGLRAAELRFGSTVAGTVLRRAADSWVRAAWYQSAGVWRMADAIAYNGGELLAASSYPVGANEVSVDGKVERRAGFEEWSRGSLLIARAVLPAHATRITSILAQYQATSVADAEWSAVR